MDNVFSFIQMLDENSEGSAYVLRMIKVTFKVIYRFFNLN
jgi:hypothetical protein